MALPMSRPYQHPKTKVYWLRKVVPVPLREAVGQRELKVSLRTKDAEAARVAARPALERFDAILATATDCELAHELLGQIRRARDQLLTFCDFPGKVAATNNVSERALRPSVIQRKVTNGYRAKWAADAEADLRTTVDTARLSGANPFQTILGAVSAR